MASFTSKIFADSRVVALVSALGILTVLSYVIYQCYFAPLAKFPGPFLAKLSRHWYAYRTKYGLWHRELMELHSKYGKAVRIAPNEISIADPLAHKEIYRAAGRFIKAPAYDVIKGHRTFDLSTETDEALHGSQRKLVARAYTMETIRKLQPAVDSVIETVTNKLDQFENQVIDLGYYLQAYAFDVVGAVSFSRTFGLVDSGTGHGILSRLQRSISSIGWVQHVPWLLHTHNRLMPIIGNWIALNDRHGHFFDMSQEEVNSWKKRDRVQKDMVSILVDTQKRKPEFDDKSLVYMMSTNIFAGSDTTSTSMRGMFLMLLRHPMKLQRLMQELDDKRAKGELSNPPKFEETEACPYLQAVMYEAVRLYPAIGSPLARVVPEGGLMVDGQYVQAGSIVGSSAWIINRMPEIWGDTAHDFNPERWLGTKEEVAELKRFFFTFGGGSRTCIGRNLSWLEMAKLTVAILLRYDMTLVGDESVFEEYGFLVFIRGLQVKIQRRHKTGHECLIDPQT